MSTTAEFLIQIADRLRSTTPEDAARLLVIARDIRIKDEIIDDMVSAALAEAKVEKRRIEASASQALQRIVREHARDR